MSVFIQTVHGRYANVNTFTASMGFEQLGAEVVPFDLEAFDDLPLGRDSIVCGYVGTVLRAFDRIGVRRPGQLGMPQVLEPWFGRTIRTSTLAEVRRMHETVFLKPLHSHKAFTGYVRHNPGDDAGRTAHLEESFDVLVSDVVDFISEWRCFVLAGEVLDARRYSGAYRAPPPDWSVLDACLAALGTTAPAGFAIDLGVTRDGRTLLVEMNDGYSLGTYGLAAVPYARLLQARWDEICAATPVTATAAP